MRKITGIAVLAVATLAGVASALDVGVGAFYSPGKVFGGATVIDKGLEEHGNDVSPGGFKGRVSLGVYEGLNLGLGIGYNDFIYRDDTVATIPEYHVVGSIPTVITTIGADYALPVGPFRPYAGGGLAIAREAAETHSYKTTDWYPGLYAEGGARYFVVGGLALEAGPRYTLIFDEPAEGYDINYRDFLRSDSHTQLFELLVGINYYF